MKWMGGGTKRQCDRALRTPETITGVIWKAPAPARGPQFSRPQLPRGRTTVQRARSDARGVARGLLGRERWVAGSAPGGNVIWALTPVHWSPCQQYGCHAVYEP